MRRRAEDTRPIPFLAVTNHFRPLGALALALALAAFPGCGGGGGSDDGSSRRGGLDEANFDCDGECPHNRLEAADVRRILEQAIGGATALGVSGTFAVVDRVGNVLAVYQMSGAPSTTTIAGGIGAVGGLESVPVPSTLAAISKAGTGAYLSSQGNAFSTRTASQIVQENFNPGELGQPGGPLFGVQFSQLPCSDVTVVNPDLTGGLPTGDRFAITGHVGPRPLPLGLSADPGGIPLYKQGGLVGGIGVEFDGVYRFDRNLLDFDEDPEEVVALLASVGFEAPSDRTGDNMYVAGKVLRYVDLDYDELPETVDGASLFDDSRLQAVGLFTAGPIREGSVFGTAASGVMDVVRAGVPAMILTHPDGTPRYPTRAGDPLPGGVELKSTEVDALLDSVLLTAFRARAAIRTPRDTAARVSIWIIDTNGNPLGFVRNQDAPVFGIDVSLQKARTAAFFSSADAGDRLNLARARNAVGDFDDYVGRVRAFLGDFALTGTHAFTDRANGNLSRPFFPDGINGNFPGPFSLPFPGTAGAPRTWSPFNTGLQLDLAFQRIVAPLGVPAPPTAIPDRCTDPGVFGRRLGNGIQIFPGSVPIYRNGTLVGAVGISGDGIDQDDMISFFGSSRKGLDFAGHPDVGDPVLGFNAPFEIRSDQIKGPLDDTRLRYVNCPEGPFRDENVQNVCDGL